MNNEISWRDKPVEVMRLWAVPRGWVKLKKDHISIVVRNIAMIRLEVFKCPRPPCKALQDTGNGSFISATTNACLIQDQLTLWRCSVRGRLSGMKPAERLVEAWGRAPATVLIEKSARHGGKLFCQISPCSLNCYSSRSSSTLAELNGKAASLIDLFWWN